MRVRAWEGQKAVWYNENGGGEESPSDSDHPEGGAAESSDISHDHTNVSDNAYPSDAAPEPPAPLSAPESCPADARGDVPSLRITDHSLVGGHAEPGWSGEPSPIVADLGVVTFPSGPAGGSGSVWHVDVFG